MVSTVRFSVDWLADAPNRCPEERATVSAIKLFLAGTNAFAFRETATGVRSEALTIAAAPLAEGIARDWWRILGRRDSRHSLLRYRNGYVLPDVALRFDGRDFEVTSRQPEYGAEGLRFSSVAAVSVARQDMESALADFVCLVTNKVTRAGIGESALQTVWSRVTASRSDPEEAAFCEAAGALDLDPYRIGDAHASLIERAGRLFQGEPLIEFLAGFAEQPDSSIPTVARKTPKSVLAGLLGVADDRGQKVALPVLREAANDLRDTVRRRPNERAYSPGYRAARGLRGILGAENGSNLRSIGAFAKLLGNPHFEPAPHDLGVGALVSRGDGVVCVHLSDRGESGLAPASQKFVFARAVGDALCFPMEGHSVVNSLHGAERQATNRAFGAEFLAPVDEVMAMCADGKDSEEVAGALDVPTALIDHQRENRDRIRQACARAA